MAQFFLHICVKELQPHSIVFVVVYFWSADTQDCLKDFYWDSRFFFFFLNAAGPQETEFLGLLLEVNFE